MSTQPPLTKATVRIALDAEQLAAVRHRTGPLVVVAGPGSGKTRVILYRIAYLILFRGVPADAILVVTFANKAAREIRDRLAKLVGQDVAGRVHVHTLHAHGVKLLRRYGEHVGVPRDFAIYDEGDQEAVLRRVYVDLGLTAKELPFGVALTAIEHAKRKCWSPKRLAKKARDRRERQVAQVYAAYQARLEANHAVDFGDLIRLAVRLLEEHDDVRAGLQQQYQHVLVDEFQDTDPGQYRMVRALVSHDENVCVVGDEDQAIYSWRGARAANIVRFQKDYPKATVVTLATNYRSTQTIVRAARGVIEASPGRARKALRAHGGKGRRLMVLALRDARAEARMLVERMEELHRRGTPYRELAVIYRVHALSRAFEQELRSRGIPYTVVGGVPFYARREVKDALAYLRLAERPDDESLLRVINTPARKLGPTTVRSLEAQARRLGRPLWDVLADRKHWPTALRPATRAALTEFVDLITALRRHAQRKQGALTGLCREVLRRTGLREALDDGTEEGRERALNVDELLGSLDAFEREHKQATLRDYLDAVALAGAEPRDGGSEDRVTLTTAHAAKGREFDVVFIAGAEDGLLPMHPRPRESPLLAPGDEPAEERRLCYVAITRARREVVLSHVTMRMRHGRPDYVRTSPFLRDLPAKTVEALRDPDAIRAWLRSQ
ncbi:MAG: UvrD-helicase domain-containing protein [Polyangiales bacterium]